MNVHKKHVYNEPEGSYNNPCNESSGSRINPNYNTLQLEQMLRTQPVNYSPDLFPHSKFMNTPC